MAADLEIRQARLDDAEAIFELIAANGDQLVPRSLGNIVESIDRFFIAEAGAALVGVAAYQIHPEIGKPEAAAVEIVSVAVAAEHRRGGVGRRLVESVIRRVTSFSPREVVVLTFAPEFFSALGFVRIEKTEIMHKLYTGCMNCAKHADPYTCPEIAMKRELPRSASLSDAESRRLAESGRGR